MIAGGVGRGPRLENSEAEGRDDLDLTQPGLAAEPVKAEPES